MDGIKFTTNGMFILDEIHSKEGKVYKDIIGGAGTFTILGNLIVSPGHSKWIVDIGNDFPNELVPIMQSWDPNCTVLRKLDRLTTRGINYYKGDNDLRIFDYLTKKKQIHVQDWVECFGKPIFQNIGYIHLVCSIERSKQIIEDICKIKNFDPTQIQTEEKLTIIWEPLPDICQADNLPVINELIQGFIGIKFIFSPNSEESSRLLGYEQEPSSLEECKIMTKKLYCNIKSTDHCVIRCGRLGSITYDYEAKKLLHMPAYHTFTPQKVVDPTGGGNSFLGGFAMGYILSHGDLKYASICGNVVSGCIIEQIGIPQWDATKKTWNGHTFKERFDYYISNYIKFEES
ncbi:protein Mak32p [Monosporozyma unispora]